jgi:hypothetical protein
MTSLQNTMMYRYQPPKSSIWGHKLRKMPAHRASRLLEDFFSRATRRREFKSASISIAAKDHPITPRLAAILNLPSKEFMHTRLNLDQSNACLQEIIRLESISSADAGIILLNQYFEISQWAIDDRPVNTRSTVTMHYGALPCLTTRLWFETEKEFSYIRQIMSDLGLCKLNKQHLKLMKRPPSAGHIESGDEPRQISSAK